jgi:hypothetical protein
MSIRRQHLVPNQPRVIVFDRYENSAEGPTIRIDIQNESRLSELEFVFRKLANGELHQAALSALPDVHWVQPLREVLLAVSGRSGIVVSGSSKAGLVCNWTESPEGWLESAEKITAVAESKKPCHQYFQGLGHSDVTVEVAYLE